MSVHWKQIEHSNALSLLLPHCPVWGDDLREDSRREEERDEERDEKEPENFSVPDKDLEDVEVDSTARTGKNIRDIFAAALCLPVVLGEEHDDV